MRRLILWPGRQQSMHNGNMDAKVSYWNQLVFYIRKISSPKKKGRFPPRQLPCNKKLTTNGEWHFTVNDAGQRSKQYVALIVTQFLFYFSTLYCCGNNYIYTSRRMPVLQTVRTIWREENIWHRSGGEYGNRSRTMLRFLWRAVGRSGPCLCPP